jgi:hypothetical protein
MSVRRGISLAELLLTMSACTVVLTMSAALIHRALDSQSRARSLLDAERSATRLAAAFRSDVHAALEARRVSEGPDDAGVLVVLQLPGGQTVEYRQSAGTIERLLRADAAVRSRELFVFPAGTQAAATQISPAVVSLTITPPPDPIGTPQSPRSPLEARVSLNLQAALHRHPSLVEAAAEQGGAP